jgi:PAS domain S-box-containing protein
MKKTVYENPEKNSLLSGKELECNNGNILYKKIIDGLSTPVAVTDVNGIIIFANSAFNHLLDNKDDSLAGKNYFQLIPPDPGESSELLIETVLTTGKRVSFTSVFRSMDIQIIYSPIFTENSKMPDERLLMIEILELQPSNGWLNEKEDKFQVFFNQITEAISVHRMITDEKGKIIDFTYEELNPAREKMINMTYSHLKDKTVRQINPDIPDALIEKYADVAVTGSPATFEYFSNIFNRHLKVKVFSPKYGYVATIIEDLTEQKNAEKLLSNTAEKYRTVFENSVEGILLIDATGTIIEWNKFLEKKTGFLKETAVGMKIWDVQFCTLSKEWRIKFPIELLQKIWIDIFGTLKENEIMIKEGQYLDTESKQVLTEDVMCPIILNGEKFLCILQRDLTERMQAEQKLKLNEEKLKLLNATKDKLFSIIAHDLRSPFNSILGYTRLLSENIRKYKVEESEMYLDIVNSSVQSTLNLLINLLSWAKNQTGQTIFKPETLFLYQVTDEVVELLNSSAKTKNISINHNLSNKIKIHADKNMLKTILQNLIFNAIKFTNAGGDIQIYAIPYNDQVEIVVSDNGVGISRKTIKSLFVMETNNPTSGTHNETGSGLGLIICSEFVAKHGGKIWVESKQGKGSSFKFTIPAGN